jgi:hypothetical protein
MSLTRVNNITSNLTVGGTLTTTSTGTSLTSNSYNVVKIQTDKDDNGSNDDGILQFTNGSSNTVKGEIRYDESEAMFEIGHGDNQGHLRINSDGYITTPYQPAFNAKSTNAIAISGTVTLTFNSVRSNASNSYNSSNGTFTAPVSGQYLFTHKGLYYAFGSSEYLDLYPYVNGSQWARYEQTGNSGEHTQVDYSEIIYLNANDTFKILASNRNIGSYNMYAQENHFSGRLLG